MLSRCQKKKLEMFAYKVVRKRSTQEVWTVQVNLWRFSSSRWFKKLNQHYWTSSLMLKMLKPSYKRFFSSSELLQLLRTSPVPQNLSSFPELLQLLRTSPAPPHFFSSSKFFQFLRTSPAHQNFFSLSELLQLLRTYPAPQNLSSSSEPIQLLRTYLVFLSPASASAFLFVSWLSPSNLFSHQDPAGIFELVEVVGNGTYGQVYKVSASSLCCHLSFSRSLK